MNRAWIILFIAGLFHLGMPDAVTEIFVGEVAFVVMERNVVGKAVFPGFFLSFINQRPVDLHGADDVMERDSGIPSFRTSGLAHEVVFHAVILLMAQ